MARFEILAPNVTLDQKALAVSSALEVLTAHGFDAWTAAHAIFHVEALDDLSIEDQPPPPTLQKAVKAWFAARDAIDQVCGPDTRFSILPDPEDIARELPWPRIRPRLESASEQE